MSAEAKTTKFNISDALLRSLNDSSKDKAALAPAKSQNRKSFFKKHMLIAHGLRHKMVAMPVVRPDD